MATAVLLASQGAIAAGSSSWFEIAHSADYTSYGKKGSFHNAGGSSSILIQEVGEYDRRVSHYKASIKNKDCDNGYGVVSYHHLDGKLDFRSEYMADGNSMTDGLGDLICGFRALNNGKKT